MAESVDQFDLVSLFGKLVSLWLKCTIRIFDGFVNTYLTNTYVCEVQQP